jgi:hypothetical protein
MRTSPGPVTGGSGSQRGTNPGVETGTRTELTRTNPRVVKPIPRGRATR